MHLPAPVRRNSAAGTCSSTVSRRRGADHDDRARIGAPRARAASRLVSCSGAASRRPLPAAAAAERPNIVVVLTDDQSVAELTPEAMPQDDARARRRRHHVHRQHRLQPPLLSLARRLSHRPVPAQLRRLRQRARLRGAHRQGLDRLLLAAGRRLPDRPHRPLPPQLRPRHAARRRLADRRRPRRPARGRRLVRLRRPADQLLRRHPERQRRPRSRRAPASPATRPASSTTAALDFIRGARTDPRPSSSCSPTSPPTPPRPPARARAGSAACRSRDGGKLGKWRDAPLPKPPSFDERNVSDKPDWIATRPALGHTRRTGPEARLALRQRQPRDRRRRRRADRPPAAHARASSIARRSSSPPTTATCSASTASSSTRSTPTRRPCGCRCSPASHRPARPRAGPPPATVEHAGQPARPGRDRARPGGRRPLHRRR